MFRRTPAEERCCRLQKEDFDVAWHKNPDKCISPFEVELKISRDLCAMPNIEEGRKSDSLPTKGGGAGEDGSPRRFEEGTGGRILGEKRSNFNQYRRPTLANL